MEQDAHSNVSEVNYPSGEFKINDTRVIYVKRVHLISRSPSNMKFRWHDF